MNKLIIHGIIAVIATVGATYTNTVYAERNKYYNKTCDILAKSLLIEKSYANRCKETNHMFQIKPKKNQISQACKTLLLIYQNTKKPKTVLDFVVINDFCEDLSGRQ
jgi:hypothetical protein